MRPYQHIAVALFTFALGFLAADSDGNFAIAFPVALVVFIVLKKLANADFHHIQVALITLLIWLPFAAITLNAFSAGNQSCVIELTQDEINSSKDEWQQSDAAMAADRFDYRVDDFNLRSIWAGAIDKKAIVKPAPLYPALARTAHFQGLVAVVVVVDTAGKVIGARAVSGHPLLRKSAEDAARRAVFSPFNVCGMPLNVSGVLTYDFGL